MKNASLEKQFRDIRKKEKHVASADYDPLYNIEQYLAYFELPPLQETTKSRHVLEEIQSVKPSFRKLTNDVVFSLRQHIYTQTDLTTVDKWSEKLMRFCEIRYSTLQGRVLKKCKTASAARLLILHMSSFFIDQHLSTKDIRPLNTALKLGELRGQASKKTIVDMIFTSNNIAHILLQFRVSLATEYALSKLSGGQTR